jgi:hypothetical protein
MARRICGAALTRQSNNGTIGGNRLTRLCSLAFPLAMAAMIFGLTVTPAHAYLDPATGSMILQVLLGGVAGLALVARLYWHRLLTLLRIRSDEPELDHVDASVEHAERPIDR